MDAAYKECIPCCGSGEAVEWKLDKYGDTVLEERVVACEWCDGLGVVPKDYNAHRGE